MPGGASPGEERIFAAELIAALSLATDLAMGFDFEHGLRSTLVAARLAERLGVDRETAAQTYHACLLQQVGVTADLHVRAEILGDTRAAVKNHLMPVWFGEPREILVAMARAVAPGAPPWVRAVQITRKVPRAVRVMPQVDLACREVAPMFVESFGLPASIGALFEYVDERWDGKGAPGAKGEEIPLAMRIAQVARDIDVQRVLGGAELAARVVGERAGSSFDPAIATCFVDEAQEMLAVDDDASVGSRRSPVSRPPGSLWKGRRSIAPCRRWATSPISSPLPRGAHSRSGGARERRSGAVRPRLRRGDCSAARGVRP